MNHIDNILQEIRAAFFLLVGFAMLAVICAVTAVGTLVRPMGWAERRSAQL
jgi:Tfp pilus assembly protein PilN